MWACLQVWTQTSRTVCRCLYVCTITSILDIRKHTADFLYRYSSVVCHTHSPATSTPGQRVVCCAGEHEASICLPGTCVRCLPAAHSEQVRDCTCTHHLYATSYSKCLTTVCWPYLGIQPHRLTSTYVSCQNNCTKANKFSHNASNA